MIRFNFIIALMVGALVFTTGLWVFNSPEDDILVNRIDEYGVSGKITLEMEKPYKNPNWKFVHCTPTMMDCGRFEGGK